MRRAGTGEEYSGSGLTPNGVLHLVQSVTRRNHRLRRKNDHLRLRLRRGKAGRQEMLTDQRRLSARAELKCLLMWTYSVGPPHRDL